MDLISQYCMSWQVVVTVKKDGELILSSRGKTAEEFLNYLSFVIKNKEIYKKIKKFIKIHKKLC